MEEHKINIPARLKNVSVGGHVVGVEDIIDDEQNKTQKQINNDVKNELNTVNDNLGDMYTKDEVDNAIDSDVLVEKERAEAAESNLSSRLSDVEARDALNIDGEGRTFATGDDFNNPDSIKRAKVATVGAILDGADEEPTAGSDNLVKSRGTFDKLSLEIGDSVEYNNVAPSSTYPFHFIPGVSYILKNNGSTDFAVSTRTTPSGATVDNICVSFNHSMEVEFIPTSEAFYLRVGSSSANVSVSIKKKNNLDERIGRNKLGIELLEDSVYKEVPIEVKVTNVDRKVTIGKSWVTEEGINICNVDIEDYVGKPIRIIITDIIPAITDNYCILAYSFNKNSVTTSSDYIEPFSKGYQNEAIAIDDIVIVPQNAKHLVIVTAQGSAVGDVPEGISLSVIENTLDIIPEGINYDTLETISLDSCAFNSEREINEYGDLVIASGNGLKRVLGFPVKKGDIVFMSFKNISATNDKVIYASTYAVRASYDNPAIGKLYQHIAPQQNEIISITYPCTIDGYFYVSAKGLKHDSYIPSSMISIKVGRNEALKDTVSFNKDTIYDVYNTVRLYANPSFIGIPLCSHQGTNAGGAIIGSARAWTNAARLGYKWLECDIQFTADNVPVFIHDEPINYRGNKIVDSNGDYVPYVSGGYNNTYVKNITLSQLKTYRWSDGSPILTLSEGFGIMSQLGMNCRLEFKAEVSNHERLSNLVTACKLFGVERIIYNCTSTDCYLIFPKLIQSGIYKRGVAAKSFTNETDAENLFKWAAEIGGTYVSIYGNSSYTQDSTFIQTMAKKYNVPLDGEDWASFGKEQIAVGVSDYIVPIKDYYEQTYTVVSNQSVDYANDTEVYTFTLSAQSNVNIASIVADGIEMAVKTGNTEKYRKTGCTNVALILNAGTYKVYLKGTGVVGSLEVRY